MNIYVVLAIISTFMFGFVTIIQKKTTGIDSITFAMLSTGAMFLATMLYWLFFNPGKSFSLSGMNYSILSGVISGIAYLFFIMALRMCKVSTVVIINSFNAAIAVVLAVILLQEKLTPTQILGVLMGLGGVILVTV